MDIEAPAVKTNAARAAMPGLRDVQRFTRRRVRGASVARHFLLLAILATGCGMGQVQFVCDGSGVAQISEVAADQPIDCAAFAANAKLALDMLSGVGLKNPPTIRVEVKSTDSFDAIGVGDDLIGKYDPVSNTAQLSVSGLALFHEWIHAWEFKNGVLNTSSHPQWCEKDYGQWQDCPNSLDAVFHQDACDLRSCPEWFKSPTP